MEGCLALSNRVNSPASSYEPNYIYLQPLLQPDCAWSDHNDLTYLAVWVALLSKDAGSRGMAIDVLIAGIEDGRAKIKTEVLLKLAQASWVKLNRLADAGREISRVSPRHAWWFAELLQQFVVQHPPWGSDMQHVLGLMLELFSELGLELDSYSREQLLTVQTTGKSAKLLKALLACVAAPNSPKRQAAHEQALAACCERAERWSRGSM
jgi:hypothetical protein